MIEIIALLRNTIHGAALQGIAFQGRPARSRENLIIVPEPLAPRLLPAVRRRGGLAHWGIRNPHRSAYVIDPGLFMEALVPAAAHALNKIMRRTEVERLPGVNVRKLRSRPPISADDTFSTRSRERVRLLAGL